MAEDSLLNSLIEKEIPEGRQALIDSHKNLAELAAYCKENYRQSSDQAKVLRETKQYASQSLASVAYQVHSLAVNMLQMMDQQMIQLKKMESDVDNVSLTVDIHKEKVARREIGILTSSKNVTRGHKIVAPPQQEKPRRYKREEIDFTALDDVGHGIRTEPKKVKRRPSISSTGSSQAGGLPSKDSFSSSSNSINEIKSKPEKPLQPPIAPPTAPSAPKLPGYSKEGPQAPSGHSQPPIYNEPPQTPAVPLPPPYSKLPPTVQSSPAPPPPPPLPGNVPAPPPAPNTEYIPPPPPLNTGGPPQPPPPPPPPNAAMAAPPPPPPPLATAVPPPPPPPQAPGFDNPMPPPPPPPAPVSASMPSPPPPPPPMDMPKQSNSADQYLSNPPPPPILPQEGGEDYLPPPPVDSVYAIPPALQPGRIPYVASADMAPVQMLYRVKALYKYNKDRDDELELLENEIVYVMKENDDGWLDCMSEDGRKGVIPGNYVVRIT